MPEQTAKQRPPQLQLGTPAPADILVRIVSPMVPSHMSSEMRNTLRLSHSIRAEQNTLIAQNSASPSDGEKRSSPSEKESPCDSDRRESDARAVPDPRAPHSPAPHSPAAHSPAPHSRAPHSPAPHSPSDSSSDSDFVRASERASKRIRRAKAPRPLRLVPGAPAPVIKSAPMRSFYGYRRVRPVYPPYSAVHWVPPPSGPVRRVVKAPAPARRSVVQDVFHGAVTMAAPMNAQPLSAQRERFDIEPSLPESDDPRPDARVRGTITLNDEAAFNFQIYNDADAKRVFMEVCEKTWDKYMASESEARAR